MLTFEPVRELKLAPFFWKPKPRPETPDLFMTLPPELRNRIYEYYLDHLAYRVWPRSNDNCVTRPEPALLRVSTVISAEITPMYYATQTVGISCDSRYHTVERAMLRTSRLTRLLGSSPFSSFGLTFMCYTDWKIERLIHILETMRTTGFEPCKGYVRGNGLPADEKARSITSGCSIVEVRTTGGRKFREPIGRAIALGRRARDEGWSKAKLEGHFAELVAFFKSTKRKWPAHL